MSATRGFTSNLALAGVAAAESAGAVGKLQRGKELTERQRGRLIASIEGAGVLKRLFTGEISYAEFATRSGVSEKMYAFAATSGLITSENQLLQIERLRNALEGDAEELGCELSAVHDFFVAIADDINARFTSSGCSR